MYDSCFALPELLASANLVIQHRLFIPVALSKPVATKARLSSVEMNDVRCPRRLMIELILPWWRLVLDAGFVLGGGLEKGGAEES